MVAVCVQFAAEIFIMTNHYDVIIIGTGSGGSTMAYKLAATGKKILILERGGFIPKETAIGLLVG